MIYYNVIRDYGMGDASGNWWRGWETVVNNDRNLLCHFIHIDRGWHVYLDTVDVIRYDTIEEFNVNSKAECDVISFNLAHV